MLSINRRSMLVGSASSALLSTTSISWAYEPITILEAVAAVVGIIKNILDAKKPPDHSADFDAINSKLDLIIKNQAILLQEIQRLKLYIDEALWNRFRDDKANSLAARKQVFDTLFVSGYHTRDKARAIELATNIENLVFEIGGYDFSAFVSFASGAAMSLYIERVTQNLRQDQFQALKANMKKCLDNWLDPNRPISVPRAIEGVKGQVAEQLKSLNEAPKEYISGPEFITRQGDQTCKGQLHFVAVGDFASGYKAVSKTAIYDCYTPHGGAAGGGGCIHCGDIPAVSKANRKSLFGNVPAPITQSSGSGDIDKLNARRNDIIAAMNRGNDLAFLEEQIRAASQALG